MTASVVLHTGAAAFCLFWAALVLAAGRGRIALALAAACGAGALWAVTVAFLPDWPLDGVSGAADVLRSAVWFAVLLVLYRRTGGAEVAPAMRRFAVAGLLLVLVGFAALLPGPTADLVLPTLGSPALLARLGLALVTVLLAENIYRNADEAARWHVNLPCIALGGLAAFDVLVCADAVLARAFSPPLLDARAVVMALAMPLLALAAVRDRRWRRQLPVSRAVVFHGATLVVGGVFLLGIGLAGEAVRHLGADWGRAVQISLLAAAALALLVAASSQSARSRLRRQIVDNFFTARHDYRREWLRTVATLSAADAEAPAALRTIRAIADPVDSPAGLLLLREETEGAPRFAWAQSWNCPDAPLALGAEHPLLPLLRDGTWIAELGEATPADLARAYGALWIAVPLLHHREGLAGIVLLAPPRAPFPLDGETFDLLRTLGREVAMFLAERRAAERLAESRKLAEYAKRFAFVAHDVKTVSHQLSLLLANAEDHMQDPEFQRDVLLTVRAATDRINTLIARLRQPEEEAAPARAEPAHRVAPAARLAALAAPRQSRVIVEPGDDPGLAAIGAEAFDAAVTHLINNAIDASPMHEPVRIALRRDGARIVIDIADRGPGMSPGFVRDVLFRPLGTSKAKGSGIGAWQARELLREAGGDLAVLTQPGEGTTMRLTLPRAEADAAAAPAAQEQVRRCA
ncbi:XrtA/PEP-CTERM system histidine kinase PrsK [Elioraea sp.]|uniref:XrtA/PEP-CTERM system histidine kinase PrsK n=1 Tax=Elioraea sp. TaxID=2185103 RepID=UPI003F71D2C2